MTAAHEVLSTTASLLLEPEPRGGGRTLANWRTLSAAGARDLVAARLAEAHLDAAVITADLGGPAVRPGSLWGVWAASGPGTALRAQEGDGRWVLTGTKPWCSGAGCCTHALVTADSADGGRLFAVDLADPTVTRHASPWTAPGMRGTDTATTAFDATPAVAVGRPGAYLERPRFWHSAVAVAAVWFGGAIGASGPLRTRASSQRADAHDAAHRGHVDATLAGAAAALREAAAAVDDPAAATESTIVARRRAQRVRAIVEAAVESTLRSTGRAGGPGPLAHDAGHAEHVADLQVYVRQSHAERDLAALGWIATELDGPGDLGLHL